VSPLPDGAPLLRADYQLTLADFKAARKLHAAQKPWTHVWLALSILLVVASNAWSFSLSGQIPFDILYYLIPIGCLLFFVGLVRFQVNRNAAKMKMFNAASQTQLSDEGVANAYSVTRNFWGWADVVGVKSGPAHILLYASATTFVIAPRRAFESEADFERFAEFARTHWQASRPAVPPIAAL